MATARRGVKPCSPAVLPAFESSAWTRIAQRALEARLDDFIAAAWFGAEQRALVSDHVQPIAEALAMIERLRRRALAPKLEISRWIAFLELGDTVEAADPPAGFFGRGVVVAIRETWNLAAAGWPTSTACARCAARSRGRGRGRW